MSKLRCRGGEIVCRPDREFAHGGHEGRARGRECVGDRNRWSGLDLAYDDARHLQFAQPLGKNRIADAFDATSQFGKAEWTVGEGAENDANPTLSQKRNARTSASSQELGSACAWAAQLRARVAGG